jgi:hypothetical protein
LSQLVEVHVLTPAGVAVLRRARVFQASNLRVSSVSDLRQEHPGLLHMRFELLTELVYEKGFLAARLDVKGQPSNGQA